MLISINGVYVPTNDRIQMNCIEYIRVSTKRQADEDKFGRDVQKSMIREFCEKNKFNIVETFEDAMSGDEEQRPGLIAAHSYCIDNNIKMIIVAKMDRLGREMRVSLNWKYLLMQDGIKVIDSTAPFFDDETPTVRLMTNVSGAVAQFAKEELLQRMYKGKQEKVRRGQYAGGQPPYGYKVVNKELIPDESTFAIVELIRKYYNDGMSYSKIAATLNVMDICTKRGGKFYAKTVSNVINSNISQGVVQYAGIKTKININNVAQ